MKAVARTAVFGVLAVGALAAAYWLGLQRASWSPPVIAPAASVPQEITTHPAHQPAPLPAGHPRKMGEGDYQTGRSGTRFAHFRVGNSNVKALLADGPTLWVGTSGGVIRYDIETDEHRLFDIRAGLLSNGIFHLSKLADRLLVGTYGGGLSRYDPAADKWENFNIQHGLADAFVYDVEQMDNGDLWIATWSGANRVQGGRIEDRAAWTTFTVQNTDGGLPNDWVYGLAKGINGDLWLATEGGLAHFQDGQWKNWKHQDGLGAPYELVKEQIQFERDPAKESSHHARQKVEMGLQDVDVAYNPNYIVSLYVGPDGVVWCGTWGGGLARFDGETWKVYTVADGLPANHVFLLESAGEGQLWVGTSNGLARYDGANFKVFTTHDGLFAENVFSLARGRGGSLWVGSYGGVARLQGLN
jgi:ligand-binding sensor domain-containing protein